MAQYQLLALDLDETLLTRDKQITEENKYWVQQAVEAGVTVIFATGRGLERVEPLRKELNLETPMVLTNGAEIWRKPGDLIERYHLETATVRKLHSLASEAEAAFWGYNDEELVGHHRWTEEMFAHNWQKFGMRHQDLKIINELRKETETIPGVEVTRSASDNIEVSVEGISKKTGVKTVCEHLKLTSEDVMAIGDNLNDYQLIRYAGLGVAMGNADKQLKEVADQVTLTNEENGVAHAIEQYLLK